MIHTHWLRGVVLGLLVGSLGLTGCAGLNATRSAEVAVADLPPEALQVTSYRSPTCGCCGNWVEHMRAEGFQVDDQITEDLESIKRDLGVPLDLASCHTAVVNGYLVEGHIPAADVRRLLAEQPDVSGIAVPGMPIGSPGMESGDIRQPYAVYTFAPSGEVTVFQEHGS